MRLRRQAALQVDSRGLHAPLVELAEGAASARALRATLGIRYEGDVYFDLEGHPFAETAGGISSREYLWGAIVHKTPLESEVAGTRVSACSSYHAAYPVANEDLYLAWWAHDAAAEVGYHSDFALTLFTLMQSRLRRL